MTMSFLVGKEWKKQNVHTQTQTHTHTRPVIQLHIHIFQCFMKLQFKIIVVWSLKYLQRYSSTQINTDFVCILCKSYANVRGKNWNFRMSSFHCIKCKNKQYTVHLNLVTECYFPCIFNHALNHMQLLLLKMGIASFSMLVSIFFIAVFFFHFFFFHFDRFYHAYMVHRLFTAMAQRESAYLKPYKYC